MFRRVLLLAMAMSLCWLSSASSQAVVSGSDLFAIDLETGKATKVGEVGSGESVIGLALLTGTFTTGPALGLTTDNELFEFDVNNPSALGNRLQVTGLQPGESLVGIDFRPAGTELWAISDKSRLYMIDLGSGEATSMGGVLDPALADTNVGFDFNPTVDRIRLEGMTGQNLRLNPETGAVGTNPDTGEPTIDGDLAYADGDVNAGVSPQVVGAAYTNSQEGAQVTELYVIDVETRSLAIQQPPNAGTLNTVGDLGVDIVAWAAFDISPDGDAYMTNPNIISMPSTGSGTTESMQEPLMMLLAGAAITTWFAFRLRTSRP